MNYRKHVHKPLAGAIALALLTGTVNAAQLSERKLAQAADAFAATEPEPLRPLFKALYVEGEHNAVLNFDYLGLAALEQGDYATAEKAFDAAIARIEAIYADNSSAKKAKSVFAEEKVKDFKGEPYERAMTYFYRGLLYARAGDFQNARASFLSAEQQSMMSESESYESTFGLMDYLAGWSSFCDGDAARAADLGARAGKVQPQVFSAVPDDVAFVGLIDVGIGPSKVGVGQYREKLVFQPSGPVPTLASVEVDSAALTPVLGADINWQATTRGGRPIDGVLKGKAAWKSGTEGASSAAAAAGYAATLEGMYSNNSALQNAGEVGMVVGLVGGLFAGAMTPAADTRGWATLPAGIELVTQPNAPAAASMSFALEGAQPIPALLTVRSGKCALSWGRSTPSLAGALKQVANPSPAERQHESANEQFRAMLTSTFPPASSTAPASATAPVPAASGSADASASTVAPASASTAAPAISTTTSAAAPASAPIAATASNANAGTSP